VVVVVEPGGWVVVVGDGGTYVGDVVVVVGDGGTYVGDVVVVVAGDVVVVVVVVGDGGTYAGDVVVVVGGRVVVVGGTVVVVSTGSLSPSAALMKITVTHMKPSSSTVTPTPT
jgi:hypothetical protein